MDLSNLFCDVFMRMCGCAHWEVSWGFGTSPVEGAYWDIDSKLLTHPMPEGVRDLFGGGSIPERGNTMVFRRFESLMPEGERRYHEMDILVKAFLGFPDAGKCSWVSGGVILNDDWVVNLKSKEERDVMTDAFLKKVEGMLDELNKGVERGSMAGIDITSELDDLLKVYEDAEKHLSGKEEALLRMLTDYMKRYVEAQEERKKVTDKLKALKCKMARKLSGDCEGCEEEEDEE